MPFPLRRLKPTSGPMAWVGELDLATWDVKPRIALANGSVHRLESPTNPPQ